MKSGAPILAMTIAIGAMLIAAGCKTSPAGGPPSTSSSKGSGAEASTAPKSGSTPTPQPEQQPSPAGSVASAPTPGATGSQAGSSGRAQTPEERKVALDKRLDDSLGTFDQQIRKEQEKNAQERDAHNAANAGSSGLDTDPAHSDEEKKEGEPVTGGSAGTEGPQGSDKGKSDKRRPGDLKSEKDSKASNPSNSSAQQGSGANAKEIPDGSDDDVVARRLRKAAEAETDPELKEKLWKEYIEYKKNAK